MARVWIAFSGSVSGARTELEAKRTEGYAALDVMEGQLERAPFLVGERYTIADIALYAYTHVRRRGRFDLIDRPTTVRLQRVQAQPRHVPITA